ncbi:MAG TPA: glycosyltransferase family 2 protein, partial [Tepidisphaeraceae bacterium]|nr:glycosyltransferase family 2 protein [Tepidisphaeraceae bacterium]
MNSSDQPRFSLVVPVYNEGANIAALFRTLRTQLPKPFEVLICYDFDEDNTLAAIDALSIDERLQEMRLVKNDIGRGVHNAIKAGMKAARSPIVVVTMADLADDYTNIEKMIELAEQGVDVVCGSRYMKGGQQLGGPWLKGNMSRFAGLSLYWL